MNYLLNGLFHGCVLMEKKNDAEIFLEYVPDYTIWYKIILIYLYHFIIFILVIAFFWWVSSNYFIGILLIQFLISCGANIPFIYMYKNIDKIQDKYRRKNEKNPWQRFFYRYSYTSSLGCAALYSPLLLITYKQPSFQIINIPPRIITTSLLPIYITIPLALILIIFGVLLSKASQGYDGDMHSYLYVMCPNRIKIFREGIFQYIRHPRFLCRFITALGIGIIANNLFAIGVVLITFIPYFMWMKVLDKGLKSYEIDIEVYQHKVPALIPRYSNWNYFFRLIFK